MNLKRLLAVIGVAVALVLAGIPVQAANSSGGQLLFSGTGGFGVFNNSTGTPTPTPFGFWIWCQSTTTNAYGNDCAGSMYFYAIIPATEGVEGWVANNGDGTFTMNVHNTTGTFAIDCSLTNVGPVTRGTTNTINVSCSSPSGQGSINHAEVSGSGS